MKLLTFKHQNQIRLGIKVEETILDLNRACPDLPNDMIQFLLLGDAGLQKARQVLSEGKDDALLHEKEITYLSPVPRPGKIMCIGHNYAGHIGYGKTELPDYPNFFIKTQNTIIGHLQPVILPKISDEVDYEGEMAVIIGKAGKEIPENKAMDYVAGYSIFNDVSARDFQKRTNQWFIGKSFDTFGPLGPTLVTADEVPDPQNLDLELRVNGILKQLTNTQDMVFNIPSLISYLSMALTLEPGDVIATGTPSKLHDEVNPHQFLKHGDIVEISITGLGKLINPFE